MKIIDIFYNQGNMYYPKRKTSGDGNIVIGGDVK